MFSFIECFGCFHWVFWMLNANTLRYVPQIDLLGYYHCQLQSLGFGKFNRPQTSLPLPLLSNPWCCSFANHSLSWSSYPNCRAAQLFIWLFAQTYLTHSQIIHRSVNDLAAELSKQSIYTFKPPPLHYPFSKDVRPNLLGLNNPSPVSVLVVEFYNRPCFPVWSFGFIVWRTCYHRVTILMSNKHGTFWIMVSYFDFCVALTEKMYVKVMKSC